MSEMQTSNDHLFIYEDKVQTCKKASIMCYVGPSACLLVAHDVRIWFHINSMSESPFSTLPCPHALLYLCVWTSMISCRAACIYNQLDASGLIMQMYNAKQLTIWNIMTFLTFLFSFAEHPHISGIIISWPPYISNLQQLTIPSLIFLVPLHLIHILWAKFAWILALLIRIKNNTLLTR